MQMRFLLPLILFIGLIALLWRGLGLHPNEVPSPLINKPAPVFQAPNLLDPTKAITDRDFLGHITLFNVWATWCEACAYEHDLLVELSADPELRFYGLDYKDDSNAAVQWLKVHGNPYKMVASDPLGDIAINWGVYGTPELFIIDKKGIVRYKQIGSMTSEIWDEEVKPMIDALRKEP